MLGDQLDAVGVEHKAGCAIAVLFAIEKHAFIAGMEHGTALEERVSIRNPAIGAFDALGESIVDEQHRHCWRERFRVFGDQHVFGFGLGHEPKQPECIIAGRKKRDGHCGRINVRIGASHQPFGASATNKLDARDVADHLHGFTEMLVP